MRPEEVDMFVQKIKGIRQADKLLVLNLLPTQMSYEVPQRPVVVRG